MKDSKSKNAPQVALESDALATALRYLKRGWSPIPIPHLTKKPLIPKWQKLHITAETAPQHFNGGPQNIGILLGEPSGDLVDVDLDWPEARALAPHFLPLTQAIFGRPGSPRSHWLYRVAGLKSKRYALGEKKADQEKNPIVEHRATGGQTVFPPSVHPSGERIEWDSEGDPSTQAPDDLFGRVQRLAVASVLYHRYPRGKNSNRHDYSLAMAGALLCAGWAEDVVRDLIEFIGKATSDEEVKDRGKNVASTAAKLEAGEPVWALPKLVEDFLDADAARFLRKNLATKGAASNKQKQEIVAKYNETYAVVPVNNKVCILVEDGSGWPYPLMHRDDFHALLANQYIPGPPDKKPELASKVWWSSPDRRQYKGIRFEPPGGPQTPGVYNLFTGWAVAPNPNEDCSLFLTHLRENVCQGDEALYEWVFAWFADLFQHPTKKPGTALVLRGASGVGKSIVGKIVRKLLGSYGQTANKPDDVVGKFNAHLEFCLLAQSEEAWWAGDHDTESVLKDMITNDTQNIQRKGIDTVQASNFIRLMVTSNARWVVPTSFGERRFAVLDVGKGHMKDRKYFRKLENQIDAGGAGRLLHEFLTADLTRIDLGDVPNTVALSEQKLASMSAEQKWWLEVLMMGSLPGDCGGKGICPCSALHEWYVRDTKALGYSRRASQTELGAFLHSLELGIRRGQPMIDGHRTYVYQFPPLKQCRQQFDESLNAARDWGDAEQWAPCASPASQREPEDRDHVRPF